MSTGPTGPGPRSSLERDIEAWLATVAAGSAPARSSADAIAATAVAPSHPPRDRDDLADTHPTLRRPTIVPDAAVSTGGRRALALLTELTGHSPVSSGQLRPGATLGEGGMGVVRLAEQVALGRTVAVKSLKPGRRDQVATLDLLREAWVTGSVEHPNVVPVHYIGLDDDGSPLIVLKRIEGVEWCELVTDPDLVEARFGSTDLLAWNLGILDQVLNAVRFAHSRGIVHRDLKPSNVMIGAFGEVYLLDWGIAVSLHDDGSGRLPLASDTTDLAGTPCYMAPEMLGRDGDVISERTDVYLAGAVLYELMTGYPPHDGDSAAEVVASVASSRPRIPPGVPGELAHICTRAMAPRPADRYPSIEALQQALHSYLQHRGSAHLATIAGQRLAELRDHLAAPAEDRGDHRQAVYRLFGACRFGFNEALEAWPDNRVASDGLIEATVAVAEYELADNDPRAALTLLGELAPPPAELLERARAAAAAQAERQAALERLQRLHDPTIGTRTRAFAVGVLGTVFTIAPLLGALTGGHVIDTHARAMVASASLLTLVGLVGLWARESMMKTLVNRRVFLTTMWTFVAQVALAGGAWHLGLPIPQVRVLMLFLWFAVAGMTTIAIDRRLAPAAVGYGAGFGLAVGWPEHTLYFMAAGNGLLTVTAVWYWRPGRRRWAPEERAAYRQRRRPRPG